MLTVQKGLSHRVRCPWHYIDTIYNISPAGRTTLKNLNFGRSLQDRYEEKFIKNITTTKHTFLNHMSVLAGERRKTSRNGCLRKLNKSG
ncbi:Protein of unknown function, partial [Gryllus bimaculatus]